MKWRTPKAGDERVRVIFALIPVECDDGQTRWLERVRVRERILSVGSLPFWARVSVTPFDDDREVYVDHAR